MSGSEDVPSVSSEPASAQTITLNGIGACTVRNVKCQMNATRGGALSALGAIKMITDGSTMFIYDGSAVDASFPPP